MKNNTSLMLAVLGSFIAGFVSLISAYLAPQLPLIWQISAGVSLALFIVFLIADRRGLADLFTRKTTRYGLSALAMCLIASGITVFLNLIAAEHDWKKDVTKNRIHTLSEQTVKVLANLKSPVVVRAFVDPRNKKEFDDFLDRYKYHSKLFKVEPIDLDRDLPLIEKYKIKQAGVLIVESETRTSRVDNVLGPEDPKLEEKLTNAIIQVAKGDKKKIYFTSGHGERLTSDHGRDGMSEIKDTMEGGAL